MKRIFFSLSIITVLCFISISTVSAARLDGLWHNDRQNITIHIEQTQDGIRTRRTDQSIWYTYSESARNRYIDRQGNSYEVISNDQIQWTEIVSRKKIVFNRNDHAASEKDDRWDDRETDRRTEHNDDTWNDRERRNRDVRGRDERWGTSDRYHNISAAGRWYNKSSKERLIIEETGNGYRVKTQHGGWEKFTADRNGQRLISRSGDIIRVLDRNTLRLKDSQGRRDQTFIRQGNGHHKNFDKTKNHNKHHGNPGKKHFG